MSLPPRGTPNPPEGTTGDKDRIHVLEVVANAIVGGMESYVRNLVRFLPADRYRVSCLFPYESAVTAAFRELGSEVFVARMDDDPPWRSIQATVEIVRSQRVDLIHANLPKAHVLAGLAGALTRTSVVATVHGNTITTHELGIARTTGTNLITVCQEAYMQALAMGVPEERVTLVYNGVDLDTFRPNRTGEGFRRALGIPADAPLVGFVGRLEAEKGPDHFVQAAAALRSEFPDTHFVLVGVGSLEAALVKQIHELGLEGSVHLAGMWADTSQVYPALDVVALTSRIEGTPLVVLEAMASGRPVVANGVGGVIEVVEHGATGLIAGPGDWKGIAERISDLFQHPDKMRAMGKAGRKRAEKQFDLKMTVQQTAETFERLAQTRPSARARWHSTWPNLAIAR